MAVCWPHLSASRYRTGPENIQRSPTRILRRIRFAIACRLYSAAPVTCRTTSDRPHWRRSSSIVGNLSVDRSSMAKRGRPATFDRNEALERAMELFWARGYEGATLEDLQAVIGSISPPSFYHAFGSNESLFREAVDLYVSKVGGRSTYALEASKTAREGVEALLRTNLRFLSRPGKAHGCFLVRGAINGASATKGAQDYLLAIRQRAPKGIKARLDRAVAEGELPPGLDTSSVAAFYATVLQGLGMRAGDGASRASLKAAADGAIAAWEPLTSSAGTSRRRSVRPGSRSSRQRSGRLPPGDTEGSRHPHSDL